MHGPMGRPSTHPKRLLLALSEEFLAKLDAWRAAQPGISPTRSEAIRYLVDVGMTATGPRKPLRKRGAKK
jgi:hypothetical protein